MVLEKSCDFAGLQQAGVISQLCFMLSKMHGMGHGMGGSKQGRDYFFQKSCETHDVLLNKHGALPRVFFHNFVLLRYYMSSIRLFFKYANSTIIRVFLLVGALALAYCPLIISVTGEKPRGQKWVPPTLHLCGYHFLPPFSDESTEFSDVSLFITFIEACVNSCNRHEPFNSPHAPIRSTERKQQIIYSLDPLKSIIPPWP